MPESNDQVLVDLHDGVQTVTLNQPTKFNALSATMVKAFSDFLPRLIGPGKTLELSWTGDPVGALEAFELGMVNRVLPDELVLGHTQELAARLAQGPAKTIALIKRAVNQAHELPLDRVLELEANYQTIAARDPNFAE